jgi:ABC-type nitrate/sulfonate/bicarbonate transport system substrate-binding protein
MIARPTPAWGRQALQLDREVMVRPRSKWRWAVLIALMGLVVTACGGDGEGEGGGDTTTPEDARTVIRFAFAPDPVWDYMNDNGMIVEWEDEFNTRVVTSSTWDEFTFFAGGHGDIVSIGTQEVPVLEQETEIKTVTFGKYNFQRSPMMTRADTGYQDLTDVPPGSPICVSSPVSNTQFWSVAMNELHDIDYFVGGGDYELIVNDHFVNPQNLLNGDCEAAVIIPEAAAPYLRTGELVLMYDGLMPFQLYNEFSGFESEEGHVMSNLFSSTEEFYDANPEAAQAFLVLWERGIEAWSDPEIQAEIIATYPQHFAVEEEEDIAYIQEFMAGENDWFVDTVYFTEEWVEAERAIWDFMVDLHPDNQNKLEEGFPQPRFEVVAAP